MCTTSLTLNNSTFCPHAVFMCFMWISEQTSIISLYNINWLVFITETECIEVFYSPTEAQVNCLKSNFKIYINIYIKTAVLLSILM